MNELAARNRARATGEDASGGYREIAGCKCEDCEALMAKAKEEEEGDMKHAIGIPGKGNGGSHAAYNGPPPPGFRPVCWVTPRTGPHAGRHCLKSPGHSEGHGPS